MALALTLAILGTAAACEGDREGAREVPSATAAVVDSFLVELGQTPSSVLDRSQRWRMISSIWAGLPPPGYTRDSLPDSDSHAAALMQAFCEQCHWMPAPQMHAAEEWPLLMRRMMLRARDVGHRLGGPLTEEIVGNPRVLEGMGITRLPTEAEVDTLIGYLQAHALPVVDPEELPSGADAELYVERCSVCHQTPAPGAYPAEEWPTIVARMVRNAEVMGVAPVPPEEMERIVGFLRQHAGSGSGPAAP